MRVQLVGIAVIASSFCSSANASITCSSIDPSDGRGNPTLFVDGPRGAYSYTAVDGSRQVVVLKCDRMKPEPEESVICAHVFKRADGLTTTHYVLPKIADFTALYVSALAENAKALELNTENYGTFEQFTVSCSERDDS